MASKIRQGKKEHHICQEEVKLFLFAGDIMTIYIENSLEFEKKKKKNRNTATTNTLLGKV